MIRSSSSRDIEQLIDDLRRDDETRREAAVARLRVMGGRADGRLAAFVASNAPPEGRVAALRALEGREEPRTLQIALAACDDEDAGVATAAIVVLRGWLSRETGTAVLDALSGIALDPGRQAGVRLAALDALSDLPLDIVRPLVQRVPISLRPDSDPLRQLDAIEQPLAMREWIAAHRGGPLAALHEAVVRIREHERRDTSARRRQAWMLARGAVHAALAERGSRVALYDLRESFDTARTPLPLDFLTAMTVLGDATCLEPLARAHAASRGETWWCDRLRKAAADIVRREKLTGRHTVLKRLRSKYEDFV